MERNSPLRRYTPLHSNKPLKRTKFAPHPKRKKAVAKRSKLPKPSTVRNKCDDLLTPIVKLMHPVCLLCPNRTEVAHHHVHKSSSNRLRYDIDNLINLCNHCHLLLHLNESYWAGKVIEYMGMEWFQKLDKRKNEYVKADVHWYIENHIRLMALHEKLLCEKS